MKEDIKNVIEYFDNFGLYAYLGKIDDESHITIERLGNKLSIKQFVHDELYIHIILDKNRKYKRSTMWSQNGYTVKDFNYKNSNLHGHQIVNLHNVDYHVYYEHGRYKYAYSKGEKVEFENVLHQIVHILDRKIRSIL